MKSTMRTASLPVSSIVSSTTVPPRQRRFERAELSAGAISQRPFSGDPIRGAKPAGLPNRGSPS